MILSPLISVLDEVSGDVSISTTIQYRMQWTDARLLTAPCRLALPSMLSVDGPSNKKAAEWRRLIWMPTLAVIDQFAEALKLLDRAAKDSAGRPVQGDARNDARLRRAASLRALPARAVDAMASRLALVGVSRAGLTRRGHEKPRAESPRGPSMPEKLPHEASAHVRVAPDEYSIPPDDDARRCGERPLRP